MLYVCVCVCEDVLCGAKCVYESYVFFSLCVCVCFILSVSLSLSLTHNTHTHTHPHTHTHSHTFMTRSWMIFVRIQVCVYDLLIIKIMLIGTHVHTYIKNTEQTVASYTTHTHTHTHYSSNQITLSPHKKCIYIYNNNNTHEYTQHTHILITKKWMHIYTHTHTHTHTHIHTRYCKSIHIRRTICSELCTVPLFIYYRLLKDTLTINGGQVHTHTHKTTIIFFIIIYYLLLRAY